MPLTPDDVARLPPQDRLALIGPLWDSLVATNVAPPLRNRRNAASANDSAPHPLGKHLFPERVSATKVAWGQHTVADLAERIQAEYVATTCKPGTAKEYCRLIKRYPATRADRLPWLFASERDQPLTRQSVNYLIAAAATRAGLAHVHPHMLRHSCGFTLANRGYDLRLIQDYLGHRDPKHTAHYTRVAGHRFEGLWK